jgi:hypothetical protein
MGFINKKKISNESVDFDADSDLTFINLEKKYNTISFDKYPFFAHEIKNNYQDKGSSKYVVELLQEIKQLQIEHDQHGATKEQLENHRTEIKEALAKENKELRNLLDAKYSAKNLLYISLSISIALSYSLYAWYFLSIPLIHPVISIPILVASLGFSLLAYWRLK